MTFPVSTEEIEAAAARLEGRVRRTPTIEVELPTGPGVSDTVRAVLKLELLQHTGSFKPRGAFNRVLSNDVPDVGLIAASGGNHGLAVAHVAQQLGVRAEIFVPESTPSAKLDRLRAVGGGIEVVVGGALYADAQEASSVRAGETGALVVHPYDQPEVVAGQGTMAREIAQQVPDVEEVLIAVGGGGLVAGAACWAASCRASARSSPPSCAPPRPSPSSRAARPRTCWPPAHRPSSQERSCATA